MTAPLLVLLALAAAPTGVKAAEPSGSSVPTTEAPQEPAEGAADEGAGEADEPTTYDFDVRAAAADVARLGADADTDVARRAIEARVMALPQRGYITASLLEHLGAEASAEDRSFPTRLSALRVLVARGDPAATEALFRLHVRSRTGDLPEDPDLFERAIRGLQALPPGAIRAALRPGLADGLRDLAHAQLTRRWAAPLAQGEDDEVLAALEAWPERNPEAWATSSQLLGQQLEDAFDQHGMALVDALQTDHGSMTVELVTRAEAALLAEWVGDEDPRVARIASEIARDKGVARLVLTEALRIRAGRPGAGEEAATAARLALDSLGEPVFDGPLGPPLALPGQVEGLPLAVPETWPEGISRAGGDHLGRSDPGALGFGLLGLLGVLLAVGMVRLGDRYRPLAALVLGLATLPLAEAALVALGVRPLALDQPLFSFTDWQLDLFQPLADGRKHTGPGSVRYQELSDQPEGRTLRVAVLGASSAHGSNHLREEAFAALLEQRLVDTPRPVEVLNLGIGGTISSGVLHAGRQAIQHGARVLIVYYGHNEVAQFTRLALYRDTGPQRLRARMLLHQSHLYSILARGLRPADATAPALQAVGGSIYATAPPDREQLQTLEALALAHYRYNLRQLLAEARDAEARVVLVNPATNYRFAHLEPFGDDGPGSRADLDRRLQEAEALAGRGRGRAAREAWQGAIDASASPREITSPIRGALRDLADQHGTAWLDADALFYAASSDGLTANGLFWDDLHPSREGHALLAEALDPLVRPMAED